MTKKTITVPHPATGHQRRNWEEDLWIKYTPVKLVKAVAQPVNIRDKQKLEWSL